MEKYWRLFNFVLVVLITSGQIVSAQEEEVQIDREELVVSAIEAEMNVEIEDYSEGMSVPEELLRQRFAKLQNVVPFVYHPATHKYVEHFIYKNPSFTRNMMARQPIFLPMFEKHLKEHGLPIELKYLSMIESALNPRIVSRVGAGGLWQFMPATGREFGLYQDRYIDERFDPEKATIAACRYMKQLYRIFGDWELVLASYNTGPGNLRRAMRRSGGSSFWTVYNSLPRETRSYVPQFVAITYLMHYGQDHGLVPSDLEHPVPVDTLHISGGINLEKFAQHSGVTLEEIARLNPQLLKTELPAYTKNFPLKIPSEKYTYLVDNRYTIWDSCFRSPIEANGLLANADSIRLDTIQNKVMLSFAALAPTSNNQTASLDFAADGKKPTPAGFGTTRSTHIVKKGETLSTIARKHRVSVTTLRKWNGLSANAKLRVGQRLSLNKGGAVPGNDSGQAKSLIAAVKAEAAQSEVENQPASQATVAQSNTEVKSAKEEVAKPAISRITHTVRKGETLSVIASKHRVSIADLQKWNSLSSRSRLQIGQKLTVRKAEAAKESLAKAEDKASKQEVAASNKNGGTAPKFHVVNKGETLSTIARKHGVAIADLQKWNSLSTRATLQIGQKLVVNQRVDKEENTSEVEVASKKSATEEMDTENVSTEKLADTNKSNTTLKSTPHSSVAVRYHVVQKGDTLWLISQKYGLTVDKLKKVNQIKGNNLKLGQKLLING